MSKGRVWNKGKHNGRGLSKKNIAAEETENQAQPEQAPEESFIPRIDTVKPMNRSNWVTRPARVVPKKPENK
ncbi:hypothetical protein [Paenibacillus jilunlii]|uniref:Uncharacterized protein n=1 Tax=Paenibacillus jilunlii TaxID=682956 RepID=A0A1G9NE21_9BACL|nr:hypothetical protein [Paenibacillus jilunlii]KWX75534.1 hypothetical protein AML91_11960 [Paenibacillus jilunlii]SDL84367.1 hypothetical protein SAMN05216191_106137 [Paenibacillus jilunlii]